MTPFALLRMCALLVLGLSLTSCAIIHSAVPLPPADKRLSGLEAQQDLGTGLDWIVSRTEVAPPTEKAELRGSTEKAERRGPTKRGKRRGPTKKAEDRDPIPTEKAELLRRRALHLAGARTSQRPPTAPPLRGAGSARRSEAEKKEIP